ncbi:GNAT family N-acetyltransferase [Zobellia uliginosa]|uniref:GNAT family N-acetyltransferase n=1 Tax=Zobellia uliginosa TaxID=143224 RepID=UPI0026E2F0CD|nr:GNAT family N-acetyltransferase [Zobellia uliginosa]MDO6516738.1 GNAT family N-acetyltransferase [Zobellia uliginosa]
MSFLTEALDSSHIKKEFSCGKEMLDNYIQKQASQDVKRKLSASFVFVGEDKIVQGYYTLSNNGIPLEHVPESFKKKLPRSYTSIPTTLLGRMAVGKKFKGNGLGKLLLIEALKRSYLISKEIGSFAVIVYPIDEDAENFYSKYGFIKLPDSGKMFLPMKTVQQLF